MLILCSGAGLLSVSGPFLPSPPTWAWFAEGHEIVALIAADVLDILPSFELPSSRGSSIYSHESGRWRISIVGWSDMASISTISVDLPRHPNSSGAGPGPCSESLSTGRPSEAERDDSVGGRSWWHDNIASGP